MEDYDSQLAERMTFREADPNSWEVSIEGLGTGLPLYVTTWAGTAMISRETFGTEPEAAARAGVLRGRIYEARDARNVSRLTDSCNCDGAPYPEGFVCYKHRER